MKHYIEAYDITDKQILGNLDGQGVIRAINFKRTNQYKALSTFRTLNNIVAYYKIVTEAEVEVDRVINTTCKQLQEIK